MPSASRRASVLRVWSVRRREAGIPWTPTLPATCSIEVPISAIENYSYCARRYALIHDSRPACA